MTARYWFSISMAWCRRYQTHWPISTSEAVSSFRQATRRTSMCWPGTAWAATIGCPKTSSRLDPSWGRCSRSSGRHRSSSYADRSVRCSACHLTCHGLNWWAATQLWNGRKRSGESLAKTAQSCGATINKHQPARATCRNGLAGRCASDQRNATGSEPNTSTASSTSPENPEARRARCVSQGEKTSHIILTLAENSHNGWRPTKRFVTKGIAREKLYACIQS